MSATSSQPCTTSAILIILPWGNQITKLLTFEVQLFPFSFSLLIDFGRTWVVFFSFGLIICFSEWNPMELSESHAHEFDPGDWVPFPFYDNFAAPGVFGVSFFCGLGRIHFTTSPEKTTTPDNPAELSRRGSIYLVSVRNYSRQLLIISWTIILALEGYVRNIDHEQVALISVSMSSYVREEGVDMYLRKSGETVSLMDVLISFHLSD